MLQRRRSVVDRGGDKERLVKITCSLNCKLIIVIGLLHPSVSKAIPADPGPTIVLESAERGFVSSTGFVSDNGNYLARETGRGDRTHNFFFYDLSGVNQTITMAQLELYNPGAAVDGNDGFESTNTTEIFSVFGGQWPASGNRFIPAVDGPLWGSQSVSLDDNGAFVTVPLDASFLNAANATNSSIFLGGSITGGHLFGFTGSDTQPPLMTRLVLTVVPEPGGIVLFAIAVSLLGLIWRRSP